MAEELIGNLGYGALQSDTKHQKLLECVLTGNSKLYLGKVYTEEQLAKLSEEEVEKLFNNYKAKLSSQMVKSLGKSIINMYSMGADIIYLNVIKMENERVEQETIKMKETRKQPSKTEVIGSFIGMGMVGFCFGIGLMLDVKTVNNLGCCINRKCL